MVQTPKVARYCPRGACNGTCLVADHTREGVTAADALRDIKKKMIREMGVVLLVWRALQLHTQNVQVDFS